MFRKSKFNQDLSKWKITKDVSINGMFDDCPVKENNKLPKWYHEEKTVFL